MDFILSAFAAFMGAFAGVYFKNLYEKNDYLIQVHVETHSLLDKAYTSIFNNCVYSNGEPEFEPPDVDSVVIGLKEFFSQKYILYTGYYSSQLQQNIDELRVMHKAVNPILLTSEEYNTYYQDYTRLDFLLTEVRRLCEDEITLRRKPFKRLQNTLSHWLTLFNHTS